MAVYFLRNSCLIKTLGLIADYVDASDPNIDRVMWMVLNRMKHGTTILRPSSFSLIQQGKDGSALASFEIGMIAYKAIGKHSARQQDGCLRSVVTALTHFGLAAMKGLAPAQYALSEIYGRLDDSREAEKWKKKAREAGYAPALFDYGDKCWEAGDKCVTDGRLDQAQYFFQESERCLLLAAKQGHAPAQFVLGLMYELGKLGIDVDINKAIHFYQLAANQGHLKAIYNLGLIYDLGANGVPENPGMAVLCYKKAAEKGHVRAILCLAMMNETGRGVPKDELEAIRLYRRVVDSPMSRDPEGQDLQEQARIYLRAAYYAQGMMHLKDQPNIPADYDQAAEWFAKGIGLQDSEAAFQLGILFAKGHLGPANEELAIKWVTQAHEWGSKRACLWLYALYLDRDCQAVESGAANQQDRDQVLYWVKQAADKEWAQAQCHLGMIYFDGDYGVPKDVNEALMWLQKAAAQNFVHALVLLGIMNTNGGEFSVDQGLARGYFEKARDLGSAEALQFLTNLDKTELTT